MYDIEQVLHLEKSISKAAKVAPPVTKLSRAREAWISLASLARGPAVASQLSACPSQLSCSLSLSHVRLNSELRSKKLRSKKLRSFKKLEIKVIFLPEGLQFTAFMKI